MGLAVKAWQHYAATENAHVKRLRGLSMAQLEAEEQTESERLFLMLLFEF